MGNLMNAAHAVGLGSCWIHRAHEVFDSIEGKLLLASWGIEGDYDGIGHVALGYALKEPAEAKPRKDDYTIWVKLKKRIYQNILPQISRIYTDG